MSVCPVTPACACARWRCRRVRVYPSDATDGEWALIGPLLPVPACQTAAGGRPPTKFLTVPQPPWPYSPGVAPDHMWNGYFTKYQFSGLRASVGLCGVTPLRLFTISVRVYTLFGCHKTGSW